MVFLVLLLDQLAKYFVLSYLTLGQSLSIIPNIFSLTLIFNTGMAFGLFRRWPSLLLITISLSLLILMAIGYRLCRRADAGESNASSRWGLSLILGGALGNWVDRLRFNAVVDFLDFHFWPVFNLADSAITVGVALYIFYFLNRHKSES